MPSDRPHPHLSREKCRCRALPAGYGLWQRAGAGVDPHRQTVTATKRVISTQSNIADVGRAIRGDVGISHGKLVR